MNGKQQRIIELILILSIAFLPSLINSFFSLFTNKEMSFANFGLSDYVLLIGHYILSIALLFYILHKNKRNYSDIGLSLRFDWKDLVVAFGLAILIMFVNLIVISLINTISPNIINSNINAQSADFYGTTYKWILLFIIIIGPIQEQLIVRGFTMTEIFNLTESKYLAVVVSVAIQFSIHLYQGIAVAILLLPAFIIMSIYFVKTGKLNPIIYAHILTIFFSGVLSK